MKFIEHKTLNIKHNWKLSITSYKANEKSVDV